MEKDDMCTSSKRIFEIATTARPVFLHLCGDEPYLDCCYDGGRVCCCSCPCCYYYTNHDRGSGSRAGGNGCLCGDNCCWNGGCCRGNAVYDDVVRRSNENGSGVDDTVTLNGIASTSASKIGHGYDCATEFASGNGAASENEIDYRVDPFPDYPNFKIQCKLVTNVKMKHGEWIGKV